MTDWPKVSVFMPTYNHEAFIAGAIESVLAQNYAPLEIVIGDDGSTDQTAEIVRSYAAKYPNIIPVLSTHNTGIPANFNRILERCTGSYVAGISGDDRWLPGRLHKLVGLLESDDEIVYAYSDSESFDLRTGQSIEVTSERMGLGRGNLTGGDVSLFFKRNAIKLPVMRRASIGEVRFDPRLKYSNDFLFDVELLARGGKIAVINEILARYGKHGGNITSSSEFKRGMFEEELLTHAIIEARYPHLMPLSTEKIRVSLLGDILLSIQVKDFPRASYRLRSLAAKGTLYFLKAWCLYAIYRVLGDRLESFKSYPILKQLARKYVYK